MKNLLLMSFLMAMTLDARASGTVELAVDESTLQAAITALYQSGALPLQYGDTSDGSQGYVTCHVPVVRFPDSRYDSDLTPRIIVMLECSLVSPRYGFTVHCPYLSINDLPPSELNINGSRVCPGVQISMNPALVEVSPGVQRISLSLARIERLALLPSGFDVNVSKAFAPVEQILLKNFNRQLAQVGNPWFNSLLPVPAEIRSYSFGLAGSGSTSTINISASKLLIDLVSRQLKVSFTAEVGGS